MWIICQRKILYKICIRNWKVSCQTGNIEQNRGINIKLKPEIGISRKNCFRYLKLMSPLNAAICTTISYTLWVEWYYLKNNYLTKGQGPMKVIMVRNTPPYGHAPTCQISLTYLERQKCYDPDKKILFKKQLFDLEVKGQGPTKVITVCDTPPYGHVPTYQI